MKKALSIMLTLAIAFTMGAYPAIAQEEEAATTYLEPKALVIGNEDGELPGLDSALDSFSEVSPLDIEIGFTLASDYVWRGWLAGDGASFQPYVTVSPDFEPLGDISFTYWADLTSIDGGDDHLENDYVIDYNVDFLDIAGLFGYEYDAEESSYGFMKLIDFNVDVGYIYYDFPAVADVDEQSQELYAGITYNLPLSPSFFVYSDFDAGRGEWYEFGIAQDIVLGDVTVCTYATLNYNKGQWGADDGFSTCDFGASIPIAIGTHMTLEPFISYTKELENDGTGLVNDRFYGGVNYSIAF